MIRVRTEGYVWARGKHVNRKCQTVPPRHPVPSETPLNRLKWCAFGGFRRNGSCYLPENDGNVGRDRLPLPLGVLP